MTKKTEAGSAPDLAGPSALALPANLLSGSLPREKATFPAESEGSSEGSEFAKETHAGIQDLIKVADAKATSLIALQGLVLVIFGSSLADDTARVLRAGGPGSAPLLIAGALMLLLTVLSILIGIGVLIPRDPKHLGRPVKARGLLWLKDLEKYESDPQGYVNALMVTTEEDRLADFAYENLKVAWILRRKFRVLKVAVWFLVVALVAWAATIVAIVGTAPIPPVP